MAYRLVDEVHIVPINYAIGGVIPFVLSGRQFELARPWPHVWTHEQT